MEKNTYGLVLSGGGARGSYQAGVLLALSEIFQSESIKNPFEIYTGVSAGAINATMLAAEAQDFPLAVKKLCDLWGRITPEQVFYTDAMHLGRLGMKWMGELSLGALTGTTAGKALLETAPLNTLLRENINYEKIQTNLELKNLKALGLTAIDYKDSMAITFVQSLENKSWRKAKKVSEPAMIQTEHVMASSAIPLLFPPIQVDQRYFGDGCVRNTHPCGPAIYLGANKLFIVGVKSLNLVGSLTPLTKSPSVARVLNVILNAILLDGIELDVERLYRVNEFIRQIPASHRNQLNYKTVDYVWISPSEDIGNKAMQSAQNLPRLIKYLIKGLGSLEEANEIISYLLFDPQFCSQLIEMGFDDGMKAKKQIVEFITKKD